MCINEVDPIKKKSINHHASTCKTSFYTNGRVIHYDCHVIISMVCIWKLQVWRDRPQDCTLKFVLMIMDFWHGILFRNYTLLVWILWIFGHYLIQCLNPLMTVDYLRFIWLKLLFLDLFVFFHMSGLGYFSLYQFLQVNLWNFVLIIIAIQLAVRELFGYTSEFLLTCNMFSKFFFNTVNHNAIQRNKVEV